MMTDFEKGSIEFTSAYYVQYDFYLVNQNYVPYMPKIQLYFKPLSLSTKQLIFYFNKNILSSTIKIIF